MMTVAWLKVHIPKECYWTTINGNRYTVKKDHDRYWRMLPAGPNGIPKTYLDRRAAMNDCAKDAGLIRHVDHVIV